MTKTIVGIFLIAIIGQVAGAIDGSIREVRTSAAPAPAPSGNTGNSTGNIAGTGAEGDAEASAELPFYLDVPQAQALFDAGETIFADARPIDLFEESHIAEAEHLDPDAFFGGEDPDFVFTYPYEQRIVIYCQGGECDASELVAIRLQGFGFSNVHILKPGFPGWVDAGLPTEVGLP